jgi:hypothetical protein
LITFGRPLLRKIGDGLLVDAIVSEIQTSDDILVDVSNKIVRLFPQGSQLPAGYK